MNESMLHGRGDYPDHSSEFCKTWVVETLNEPRVLSLSPEP